MTGRKAIEMDTEFDAEFDESTNSFGVFGLESGFCYDLYTDESEAIAKANARTVAKAKTMTSTSNKVKKVA